MKEKKTYQPITWQNVCLTYELLHKQGYISFPLSDRSKGAVESLTDSIFRAHFGVDVYDTLPQKLVALLYFLIKDHPFTDGNKRTAALVFEVACDINDLEPDYNGFTLDELVVFIEQISVDNYHDFIRDVAHMLFGE